jgi:predicted site-specific integrase-resolvase
MVTEVGSVLDGHRREFLTSLCARLYGRRVAMDRAARAVAAAVGDWP